MLLADEARSEYDQPMRDTFTKDIPFLQSLHIMQRSNLLTNTFSLTEFLLSKSSVLNQGLSVLEPLLTKHFSPYINLTVFKNISKEIIRKILYNEKIRENLFSLKFDFKMLQHSGLAKEALKIIYSVCSIKNLFVFQVENYSLENQFDLKNIP